MKNLRIFMPLANGEQMTLEFENGREAIDGLVRTNPGAAPRSLVFEAQTADRRTIRLIIPYSDTDPARVLIEGD